MHLLQVLYYLTSYIGPTSMYYLPGRPKQISDWKLYSVYLMGPSPICNKIYRSERRKSLSFEVDTKTGLRKGKVGCRIVDSRRGSENWSWEEQIVMKEEDLWRPTWTWFINKKKSDMYKKTGCNRVRKFIIVRKTMSRKNIINVVFLGTHLKSGLVRQSNKCFANVSGSYHCP